MTQTDIHDSVRKHYADQIKKSSSCCNSTAGCSPNESFYPKDLLTTLPSDLSATSYGCGDPISLAELQPGQIVLDLGSGAGLDCLLASKKVGETGRVIGVDMTPEMIERAQINAKRVGATNVEFRQGYLEDLPVEANSVDVIISNCVINLAPDKSKVFAEIARVLKSGGKVAVSDIVTDGELPEEIKSNLSAWAGCVAGALDVNEYKSMLAAAGLTEIAVTPTYFDDEIIDQAVKELGDPIELKVTPRQDIARTIFSARITARKP